MSERVGWYVRQRGLGGEPETAILWQDDKPGEKTHTGKPTGIVYVAKLAPEHHELSLRELDRIYQPMKHGQ